MATISEEGQLAAIPDDDDAGGPPTPMLSLEERNGARLWQNEIEGCDTPPRLKQKRKEWRRDFEARREEKYRR